MRSDYLDMRGLFPKFENLLKYVEEMARYKPVSYTHLRVTCIQKMPQATALGKNFPQLPR